MSLEVYGDEGDVGMEGYVTEERAEEMFIAGAQAMREIVARFVDQDGQSVLAESVRNNWHPSWGVDPGKPNEIVNKIWEA